MTQKIIYPGTFDPITNGHLDIIERASQLFPQVIIAVAANSHKKTLFSAAERTQLVTQSISHLPNVSAQQFHGLLIDFVKAQQARVILRGIRAIADFEYERQLASMNQHLLPDLETIFLTPAEIYTHISSSFVREIAALNGNVSLFVPPVVVTALAKHVHQQR